MNLRLDYRLFIASEVIAWEIPPGIAEAFRNGLYISHPLWSIKYAGDLADWAIGEFGELRPPRRREA